MLNSKTVSSRVAPFTRVRISSQDQQLCRLVTICYGRRRFSQMETNESPQHVLRNPAGDGPDRYTVTDTTWSSSCGPQALDYDRAGLCRVMLAHKHEDRQMACEMCQSPGRGGGQSVLRPISSASDATPPKQGSGVPARLFQGPQEGRLRPLHTWTTTVCALVGSVSASHASESQVQVRFHERGDATVPSSIVPSC